ncbi:hypothetical protein QR680_014559 [Steinernema hermaphroditum]|uniref:Uncharacterized protein n=1 Tax=Steinernema hermaphroditum TaxID=289476 RepID=A0AA39IBK9_9BILA|nr:hypothetical protein QR680_014559 [Steinernema hermaphroditum]
MRGLFSCVAGGGDRSESPSFDLQRNHRGRTEYQTIEEMRQKPRVERVFERSRGRSARSTFSGLPPSGRQYHSSSRTSTPTNTSVTNSPNLSARLFGRKRQNITWLPGRKALSILRESTMRQKFASLGKRRSFGSMSLLCINPRLIGPPTSR